MPSAAVLKTPSSDEKDIHTLRLEEALEKGEWGFLYSLDTPYLPALIRKLEAPACRKKYELMTAIHWIRPWTRESVLAIAGMLGDDDEGIRFRAALMLLEMWPDGVHAVPLMGQALDRETDAGVARQLIRCIGKYGKDSAPCIPAVLRSIEEWMPGGRKMKPYRDRDLEQFKQFGSRVDMASYAGIHDGIVSAAAATLGHIGQASADTVPILLLYLGTLRNDFHIIKALGDIGITKWNRLVLGRLQPLLLDKEADEHTAFHAAIAVARLERDAELGIWFLKSFVEDRDRIDFTYFELIGLIGPKASQLVPLIKPYAEQDDPKVKIFANQALCRIEPHDKTHFNRLLSLMDTVEIRWKSMAIRAIGDLGRQAKDAIPLLERTYMETPFTRSTQGWSPKHYRNCVKHSSAVALINIRQDMKD